MGKTSTTGALVNSNRDWKRTDQNIEVECCSINQILDNYEIILDKLLINLSTLRNLKKSISFELLSGRKRVKV